MNQTLIQEILEVVEQAAIASAKLTGLGQKDEADAAAVEAMRLRMGKIEMKGKIVIGEGERDEAPMLYIGEEVGSGNGPGVDFAVDLEEAGVDRIQFDVMDGNFVPNLTFGPEMIAACRKYCDVPFETQLMVSQYNCETMLDSYVSATKGPNGEPGVVIAHAEANVHLHRVLGRIRDLGGSPSVALNPHTPFEMIENIMDMVDHVLVMTVNPGFGGQAYIPTMLNKIRKIRKFIIEKNLNVDIEVDGGIKANWTISQCAEAGANCFIAGSGMFAYPTLKEGCDELRSVAKDAQNGKIISEP